MKALTKEDEKEKGRGGGIEFVQWKKMRRNLFYLRKVRSLALCFRKVRGRLGGN